MQAAEQANFAPFDASGWKLGLVVAQFNQHITGGLRESALERAKDYGVEPDDIVTVPVAGAGEMPLVLQSMAESGSYDVMMAIGCVIRGETAHFDYVCSFITDAVLRVQLDWKQPISFSVLMCNTEAEAQARVALGADHLDAVMHQAKLLRSL